MTCDGAQHPPFGRDAAPCRRKLQRIRSAWKIYKNKKKLNKNKPPTSFKQILRE
jgi:hypothetical protein